MKGLGSPYNALFSCNGKKVFLAEFAPKFAQLNDDVLFGEVWSREDKLSLRDRSLVTVVSLMAQGLVDSSFYTGWPKAWAAFRMAKEVWAEECPESDACIVLKMKVCKFDCRTVGLMHGLSLLHNVLTQ